jgi:serine/threonine protein kinase
MELRVGGKYKFTKRLGQGAFGDIYSGINIKSNEEVAIKLVSRSGKVGHIFLPGLVWARNL